MNIPDYSNAKLLTRFRYWLIKKLAGKSCIAINAHVMPFPESMFTSIKNNDGTFLSNVHFDQAGIAPNDGKHGFAKMGMFEASERPPKGFIPVEVIDGEYFYSIKLKTFIYRPDVDVSFLMFGDKIPEKNNELTH